MVNRRLVLAQLHGWVFTGWGIQPSAVWVLRISHQVLKFRRKVTNNDNVFSCCKEEWFGEWLGGCSVGLCHLTWNLAEMVSVWRGKVWLRFMITFVLKGVTKAWIADSMLFPVVFVACVLLLVTCCPRHLAGGRHEECGFYMHRTSMEVLAVYWMLWRRAVFARCAWTACCVLLSLSTAEVLIWVKVNFWLFPEFRDLLVHSEDPE